MALPNDFRGIPAVQQTRAKWTIQAQQGFSSGEVRASVQGQNFVLSGNTSGITPPGTYYIIGYPYFDARTDLLGDHSVLTFDVESSSPAPPTEYLTDPATGLPSGITRSGAAAAGYVETVNTAAEGGDLSQAGASQNQAQQELDQIAADNGEPVGPGPGAATDEFLQALADFQATEAQRRADEIAAIAAGGGTATNAQAAAPPTPNWLTWVLVVAGILAGLKLLKVI